MLSSSSSSNEYVTLQVREEYPYPSHVCAPNFVTFKLSGRDDYSLWKTQMLCLLESHGMYGFVDGTLVCPQTSSSVDQYRLWKRSDALVKGWILGSLSKAAGSRLTGKLHQHTTADFTAKIVWDELQTIYGPVVCPHRVPDEQVEAIAKAHQDLYEATLAGNWRKVNVITVTPPQVKVTDKITNNGNTALHVAVGTTKTPEFLENMLGMTPENTEFLDLVNLDGSTLLHVAAIVGNTKAAEILVEKNPNLLLVKDNEGQTPLAVALSNMHTETCELLLKDINTDIQKDLFSGPSGDELLVTLISSRDFRLAHELTDRYSTLHSYNAVLMAIAHNFPCELNILEKYIDFYVEKKETLQTRLEDNLISAMNNTNRTCALLCGSWVEIIPSLFFRVWPFVKERARNHKDALKLLKKVCHMIRDSSDLASDHHQHYTNSIHEATRQNAYEVVHHIVNIFPNAIWSANEDGHNIIQNAVISRSEHVYNLVYQMSEHKNVYRTNRDSYENNLLHLVARLAPINKLNLISGAALQIQRELQWFKEVKGFVCPLNVIQKNSLDETPQMVFTREHKELVVEGEKWMKATAKSYTITAALITTIVFAAAITVPGGNNQDTGGKNQHRAGLPVFTNTTAFNIFALSDAISLFMAVTSLLMFLSILTARFAEKDFLFKLPTKLIIGAATLFISTTAMVIAFGATLYLVFGQSKSWILIPIAVLTCIPITSFVTLQFPLVIDLMNATYGRSIFGKKRDDPFY